MSSYSLKQKPPKTVKMKKCIFSILCLLFIIPLLAGIVQKKYTFSNYRINTSGIFQYIVFEHTVQSGLPGEPLFPFQQVALLVPPGECAESIEVIFENEILIPGNFNMLSKQLPQIMSGEKDSPELRNLQVYSTDQILPLSAKGHLKSMFLHGYSIAVSSFTPLRYNPVRQSVSYFQTVTVKIITKPDPNARMALKNISGSVEAAGSVRNFVQNPEMAAVYPERTTTGSEYQMLIITPQQFVNSFQDLVNFHNLHDIQTNITTVEYISANSTGQDLQEKIRNFIIAEYQTNSIGYLLLGGDVALVPSRGFYSTVQSSTGPVTDFAIPADLYYAALDGNWNDPALINGNPNLWGEPGEDDLLPELSVGRMSFSNDQELSNMIHKTISYQASPIPDELQRPLMVGEHLYSSPMTFGSDYLNLLINDHTENGYFTHGIQENLNEIEKLYDSLETSLNIWQWSKPELLSRINSGKSFIHHDGHCSVDNMMRLFNSDITNENFSEVNGTDHNYQLLYTQGCLCGAFDNEDCIAELCLSIENFLAAGVFNSRYGWFNQGTTDGPGIRLHREFTGALYHDSLPMQRLGDAHRISKIKTAPWVTMPGEFEPGAQRWNHYCNNVLGDPALYVWTNDRPMNVTGLPMPSDISVFPVPCHDQVRIQFSTSSLAAIRITIFTVTGQRVYHQNYLPQTTGMQQVFLHLDAFNPGIYMGELQGIDWKQKMKIIVN